MEQVFGGSSLSDGRFFVVLKEFDWIRQYHE